MKTYWSRSRRRCTGWYNEPCQTFSRQEVLKEIDWMIGSTQPVPSLTIRQVSLPDAADSPQAVAMLKDQVFVLRRALQEASDALSDSEYQTIKGVSAVDIIDRALSFGQGLTETSNSTPAVSVVDSPVSSDTETAAGFTGWLANRFMYTSGEIYQLQVSLANPMPKVADLPAHSRVLITIIPNIGDKPS
jgi:hypothetical protein